MGERHDDTRRSGLKKEQPGQGLVAVLARVIDAAAFHLYCDDVELGPVVNAAGLRIEVDSTNLVPHPITSFEVFGNYAGGDA